MLWGNTFEDVHILKMTDGKGGERQRALDALPFLYTIRHHSHAVRYCKVQSGSDQRAGFQPLRHGYHGNWVLLQLPWLPLLFDGGLSSCWLSAPLEGYRGGPRSTRALVSAMGGGGRRLWA